MLYLCFKCSSNLSSCSDYLLQFYEFFTTIEFFAIPQEIDTCTELSGIYFNIIRSWKYKRSQLIKNLIQYGFSVSLMELKLQASSSGEEPLLAEQPLFSLLRSFHGLWPETGCLQVSDLYWKWAFVFILYLECHGCYTSRKRSEPHPARVLAASSHTRQGATLYHAPGARLLSILILILIIFEICTRCHMLQPFSIIEVPVNSFTQTFFES